MHLGATTSHIRLYMHVCGVGLNMQWNILMRAYQVCLCINVETHINKFERKKERMRKKQRTQLLCRISAGQWILLPIYRSTSSFIIISFIASARFFLLSHCRVCHFVALEHCVTGVIADDNLMLMYSCCTQNSNTRHQKGY